MHVIKTIQNLLIHQTKKEKLILLFYFFILLCLFFYSFTQIDLGLVITRIPSLYAIEKQFQYIGYFNRPLSAGIYTALMILLSLIYLKVVWLFKHNKASLAFFICLVGLISLVLLFSYNAFSYDFFNYIFDAKIVTHYHQNPYLQKAIDYPADPMLGFMHWTQRTYPYGPGWLALTIPLSFIGSNYFVLTLYLFKLLVVACYSGTIYVVYKVLKKLKSPNALYQTSLFALNPLVINECLVSGHNDIVMFFFALLGLNFLLQKKYGFALLLLLFSISIKFVTIFFLPLFIMAFLNRQKIESFDWQKWFMISFCLSAFVFMLVVNRTVFEPWYLLYLLILVPFITKYSVIQWVTIGISFLSLLIYLPFLYFGMWDSSWYVTQVLVYSRASILLALVAEGFAAYLLFKKKRFI